jgi:hypothetical protein
MPIPDAAEILRIWEDGTGATPSERSVAMLRCASSDAPLSDLVGVTVGERDRYLIALRAACFGKGAAGLAACPKCRLQVEFQFDVTSFLVDLPKQTSRGGRMSIDGYTIEFRSLTVQDLLHLSTMTDLPTARQSLIEASVLSAEFEGQRISTLDLPNEITEALGDAVYDLDPQSDTPVGLACPGCGHEWQAIFDIASFLYREFSIRAERTLHDVHLLARTYGWQENEILTMSPARRRIYLDMASR